MKNWAFSFLAAVLTFAFAGPRPAAAQTNPAPEAVLICGDSIMKLLAVALERDLARRGITNAVSFTSIGSGLARLDLLDWHAKLKSLTESAQPAVAVILLGSNDNQPMKVPNRPAIVQNTQDWKDEYTRRVAACLGTLRQGGVRQVFWLGLPDMREPALQQHADLVNQIFRGQLLDDPRGVFIDTQALLSREAGQYSSYILGPDGMPIHVRAADGIHLSRPGAELLARDLGARIEQSLARGSAGGAAAP